MAHRFWQVGRKDWTFAGSDSGGRRAGAIYTLIETCKLNDVDPRAWLADVLARIAESSRQGHRGVAALELVQHCRRPRRLTATSCGTHRMLTTSRTRSQFQFYCRKAFKDMVKGGGLKSWRVDFWQDRTSPMS
jgi:hypothetical protein